MTSLEKELYIALEDLVENCRTFLIMGRGAPDLEEAEKALKKAKGESDED